MRRNQSYFSEHENLRHTKGMVLVVITISFLAIACGPKHPNVAKFMTPEFLQKLEPVEQSQPQKTGEQDGSLWNGDYSADFFYLDNKAKNVGDLLTVIIEEESEASKNAKTDLKKNAKFASGVQGLTLKGLTDKGVNVGALGMDTENNFTGEGTTSRSENFNARMTVRVVEKLADGNLRIAGKRYVQVNGEKQIMMLVGIVRTQDVRIDNIVLSSYIADAEIYYEGEGVISDKQTPGWLARTLDIIWPF